MCMSWVLISQSGIISIPMDWVYICTSNQVILFKSWALLLMYSEGSPINTGGGGNKLDVTVDALKELASIELRNSWQLENVHTMELNFTGKFHSISSMLCIWMRREPWMQPNQNAAWLQEMDQVYGWLPLRFWYGLCLKGLGWECQSWLIRRVNACHGRSLWPMDSMHLHGNSNTFDICGVRLQCIEIQETQRRKH